MSTSPTTAASEETDGRSGDQQEPDTPRRRGLVVVAIVCVVVLAIIGLVTFGGSSGDLEPDVDTPAPTAADDTVQDESEVLDAPPGVARERLGIYPGFGDEAVLRTFEEELGRDLDVVAQFGGSVDEGDLSGSIRGQTDGLRGWIDEREPTYSVTIPLAFGDVDARSDDGAAAVVAGLRATAGGDHDDVYGDVADVLVGAGLGDAVLRLGHEFDAEWYAWSARPDCDAYIDAYRRAVDTFRSVSTDFRFEWTGTLRNFAEWGPCAYPGDDVVDIVGLDVYDQGGSMAAFDAEAGTWRDPAGVWDAEFLPRLEEHLAFAIERDKPVSYPEWGVVVDRESGPYGGDNPYFVDSMATWLDSLPASGPGALSYHAYFLGVDRHDIRRTESANQAFLDAFG